MSSPTSRKLQRPVRHRARHHARRQSSPACVPRALPWALALCFAPLALSQPINALTAGLPRHGVVAAGTVTGNVTGNTLALTQTGSRAVIDWQSFNIDPGRTVQFVQPGATAAVLNRVSAGTSASEIAGTLAANGMVLLMNPNGVLFKSGASIHVGSLVATTGTVNQGEFTAGGNFGISGVGGGSVVNQGAISTSGLVALVAPTLSNQGRIIATGGRIALAGADRATISLNGGLYEFAVPGGALGTNASISNGAAARLEGAQLLLSTGDAAQLLSGVINLQGVQQASSAIVVNGHTVVLTADLNAPGVSGSSSHIQVQAGASIQDAVRIARTGTPGAGATVEVLAGDYVEAMAPNKALVTLDKAHLTLSGHPGARLRVPDAAEVNGLAISAGNVTVQGLEIAGPLNAPYHDYYATPRSNISRGIAVGDGVTGFTLGNNHIHDVRNGILIHGRNSTGSVSHNTIDNTKSGVSVQYTDAAGISIAGNREGAVGNEWGLNLHLNGHLVGSTIVGNNPPIAAAPTTAWQQSLLELSRTNHGWAVQDQGYSSASRTHVQVATSGAAGNQGSRLTPLHTVQGGIDAVVAGGTVAVAAGSYAQGTTLRIARPLTLAGAGEASTVIDARSISNNYGISVSASDVTLRDFSVYGPAAFFAAAYGIKVSPGGTADARLRNFSITRVTSRGAGKAELDLNGVDGALIEQLTLNGAPVGNDAATTQGAGLQLTDSANVTVRSSRTLNNAWGGLAIYQANRSYNQRVDHIRIDDSNAFAEANPVYLQDESALHDFGRLDIAGFGYAVRNAGSAGSSQYTWLQATPQAAYDHAVNLPLPAASHVQGWDGTATTPRYQVGVGQLAAGGSQAMSIATAISQSASGADIEVGPGRFAESVTLAAPRNLSFDGSVLRGLTLQAGAAGAGLGGQLTVDGAAGITIRAPVRLLADTTLATTGSLIALAADVQNAGSIPRALTLAAGSGSDLGDVSMSTGGSEGNPLGRLEVRSNRFTLADTLWVQGYAIDALGDVALSDHTLNALDAGSHNTLSSSGDVTGSTVSRGSVALLSGGNVQANVTSDGATTVSGRNVSGSFAGQDVSLTAQERVDVDVTAAHSAALAGQSVAGRVSAPSATVQAVSEVQLLLDAVSASVHAEGSVNLSGRATQLSVDAPAGSVSGDFGQVSNAGNGLFSVNGRPELNPRLSATAENNRVNPVRLVPGRSAAPALALVAAGQARLERRTAATAGALLERGEAVEIELGAGPEPEERQAAQ